MGGITLKKETQWVKKSAKELDIPENASVMYFTPTKQAGKYNRWNKHTHMDHSEERIREIAAGAYGNGSGYIWRRITFSEYVNQGKLTGVISYKLEEELPPVTKFDEAGKKNRKLYFELVNCKHKETRTDMYGAGCNKDYETTCRKCGELVI